MTYNDSNQLVTSNKSHSTFLIFNFEIFFLILPFRHPFLVFSSNWISFWNVSRQRIASWERPQTGNVSGG